MIDPGREGNVAINYSSNKKAKKKFKFSYDFDIKEVCLDGDNYHIAEKQR